MQHYGDFQDEWAGTNPTRLVQRLGSNDEEVVLDDTLSEV